jgi:hypothetical protein
MFQVSLPAGRQVRIDARPDHPALAPIDRQHGPPSLISKAPRLNVPVWHAVQPRASTRASRARANRRQARSARPWKGTHPASFENSRTRTPHRQRLDHRLRRRLVLQFLLVQALDGAAKCSPNEARKRTAPSTHTRRVSARNAQRKAMNSASRPACEPGALALEPARAGKPHRATRDSASMPARLRDVVYG